MVTSPLLSIISDEVSQNLADLSAFQREFNLPGLELRSFNGRSFKDLTSDDIAEIARASRSEGWKVVGCATPIFKCDLLDAAAVRSHRELFARCLETAARLDCDLVRVFTFLRSPHYSLRTHGSQVADELQYLVQQARSVGIRLGIENEHTCLAATADETLAAVSTLPAEIAGIIWDPCNVIYVPDAPLPTPEQTERVLARTFHIHVKDAVRRCGNDGGLPATALPVGIGAVGWRGHLAAIARSGYRGWLSLETHWRVLALDESQLHLPAGYQFSEGGAVASRTCLHNLRAMLETP